METIALIESITPILLPFLAKSGEAIAKKVGEDLWGTIKSTFTPKEREEITDITDEQSLTLKIEELLITKMDSDPNFKTILMTELKKAQQNLSQQNINNNAVIEKQINIQDNSGTINM